MAEINRITLQEVYFFFEEFCRVFSDFDGQLISERFACPYMALDAEGRLCVFLTPGEIAEHFQLHLNRYREQGCSVCRFEALSTADLGASSILASVNWRLLSSSGALLYSWRESYNLLKINDRLFVYASTDHV